MNINPYAGNPGEFRIIIDIPGTAYLTAIPAVSFPDYFIINSNDCGHIIAIKVMQEVS